MKHEMPTLPYAKNSLAPFMSEETLDYHYGKHLQAYVTNLNKLIEGTAFENASLEEIIKSAEGGIFNNAAQAWNHTFFFETLSPTKTEVPEKLKAALTSAFGSVETFIEKFSAAAAGLFGSGWVWLVEDASGKLSIESEPNAGNPLRKNLKPLLTLDVWEHAYYIDYRNSRPNFITAYFNLVDWNKVAARL